MGYRLDVTDVVTHANAYGSKYFGYLSDEELEESKSYQYLKAIFGEDYPGLDIINISYACPKFVLTAQQFRNFYAYYVADLNKDFKDIITYDAVNSTNIYLILYTENNKEVSWT